MINTVYSLLAFVFVLGILVFVHELGHFLVARWVGVRVLTFSLGFPPRVWGIKRGGTDYCIGAIPLGGFVKMAGENPDDPHTGAGDEFMSRSKWDRFRILFAGPAMNIMFSVVLMTIVLLQGAQVPVFLDDPVVVGSIAKGSPAERAGIRPGDRIIKVSNLDVATWEQFYLSIGGRADRAVPLTVRRDGREAIVTVTPVAASRLQAADIGALPNVHPHVGTLKPGEPAEKAGLKVDDVIEALNGETIAFREQLSAGIRKFPDVPITLRVARGGSSFDLKVTPRRSGAIGLIGVGLMDATKLVQPGPLGAVKMSVERNVQFAGLIVQTLGGLFTRETSPSQLMGPVAIAQLSGDYAAAGWMALFIFMASLSLNLGLLNLLPIPVLDGGHIFIMALESAARREFSLKMKERMLMAGFAVLMLLMVTVIYNDLARLPFFERLIPGGH